MMVLVPPLVGYGMLIYRDFLIYIFYKLKPLVARQ